MRIDGDPVCTWDATRELREGATFWIEAIDRVAQRIGEKQLPAPGRHKIVGERRLVARKALLEDARSASQVESHDAVDVGDIEPAVDRRHALRGIERLAVRRKGALRDDPAIGGDLGDIAVAVLGDGIESPADIRHEAPIADDKDALGRLEAFDDRDDL